MRDFWDLNNDGQLDIGEKSLRDATILTALEEAESSGSYSGSSSSSGANVIGGILLIIGIILLFGACAA